MFVDESATHYAHEMFAPFAWVDGILLAPLPIKIRTLDLIMLLVAVTGAKGQQVRLMRTMLYLAMGTTVLWFFLGVLRGGDARMASWQVYLMLAMPVTAFAVAGAFTKAAHYRTLAKAIVAAGFYRAVMCLIYYFGYVRPSGLEPPATLTTHEDSVLWVVTAMIVVVNWLNNRDVMAKLGAFLGMPVLILAIHFNNRRLAWMSLFLCLIVLYFLMPKSKPKNRLRKVARMIVPVVATYVMVGWGRTEPIFKPVAAFSTVSEASDNSTKARNVENLSLIATASFGSLTGTGWGHRYIELSNRYSIAHATELWPYVPHNSILGLFAYTGFLGVMGFWMIFPTAMLLHARTVVVSSHPMIRGVGLLGVLSLVVALNQLFGDMGIFEKSNMYMIGMSMGAAMRVPIEAEAWTTRSPPDLKRPGAPPPEPPPIEVEVRRVGA